MSIDPGVQRTLDALGVVATVVACDPALADTAAFCAHYGYAESVSANTIVVSDRGEPPGFVACVVLATTRLDVNQVVRRRLGARKASFATAEQTEALTGMAIGGVTPFGLPAGLRLWIDGRVFGPPEVIVGGGSRSAKLLVDPRALLRIPGAERVDDLAKEPPVSGG